VINLDHPVTDTFVALYVVGMELKSRIIIMERVLFVIALPMCLARYQSTGRFFFSIWILSINLT